MTAILSQVNFSLAKKIIHVLMSATMKRTIQSLKCRHCSHEWFPRSIIAPKKCPRCKNPWNQKRKYKKHPALIAVEG